MALSWVALLLIAVISSHASVQGGQTNPPLSHKQLTMSDCPLGSGLADCPLGSGLANRLNPSACRQAHWDIPDVDRAELDKHDLSWIGCGFTACAEADEPSSNRDAASASTLCTLTSVRDLPFVYLGHIHPNQTGAFTTTDVISRSNIGWLDSPRYVYRLGETLYILTESDTASDQLDVFYTLRALEILRTRYPTAYEQLIVQAVQVPNEPSSGDGEVRLPQHSWKNRTRSILISFDSSPKDIAAGVTVLDAAPKTDPTTGLKQYSNVDVISIDRETIRGQAQFGSRPLYGKANPEENYLRYMREGLVETLVHELLHRQIDRLSSIDDRMKALRERRTAASACEVDALEEVLVAGTSLDYFRRTGGLGENLLAYHDKVLANNQVRICKCREYSQWETWFRKASGSESKYELRLLDLR
jgi:hypothetical protein